MTDGEAMLVVDNQPVGVNGHQALVEGWLPYRLTFDVVWGGRRHVVMGASQIGSDGDTNISSIGPFARPSAQLLGPRGAPGNTVNHHTSYWVPNHSRRVFVEKVDFISGLGPSRAARLGGKPAAYKGQGAHARLVSIHPGVQLDEVNAKTGFTLETGPATVLTRDPTSAEMQLIAQLDPGGLRYREVSV
jgi:acyl CoA:acetate/3-ketoacid CoA transferase beta subunit